MALSDTEAVSIAKALVESHAERLRRDGAVGKVARYLAGDHDLPYTPSRSTAREFRRLAERSITNVLPLVADTFAKGLFVDGYRPPRTADNSPAWDIWQANGLDARQSVIHRGALEYGASYTLTLPGDPVPVIRTYTPVRMEALFEDDDADFPRYALIRESASSVRLIDDVDAIRLSQTPNDPSTLTIVEHQEHGLGVCPVVRFRDRLDGQNVGIVRPLLPVQDRINEAVFALLVALQFASFRQRWATGLEIPRDPATGQAVEPFSAAVNRLWVSDSPDTKFGDFAQTDVTGHLKAFESAFRSLAAIAQVPPSVLTGDLVNLSADALAAAEASTQRKIAEFETIFGESWEATLALATRANGDDPATIEDAEVRWRDTEARSLASTVDALGKIAQTLLVPVEALWERIPGVTDGDIERWKTLSAQGDGLTALAAALDRNLANPEPAPSVPATEPGA